MKKKTIGIDYSRGKKREEEMKTINMNSLIAFGIDHIPYLDWGLQYLTFS
jgi:hypothetical protein